MYKRQIFNFPVKQADHPVQAVLAAREIQRRFSARREELLHTIGADDEDVEIGIGIGIDSGETNFGEFGQAHRDLTAVGTVVNRAARAQSEAQSGEIMVTQAVRDRTGAMIEGGGSDHLLKGFREPVTLFRA